MSNFSDPDKGFYPLFSKFAPVGCRDNSTKELLQSYGLSAYLQGCITNILPCREEKEYKKIFLVDVPKEILEFIPKGLLEHVELVSNAEDIGDLTYEQNYQRIKERYEYYRDNAALVISSRYHVVTPCNAMGIPCIFVKRTVDKHIKDIRLDTLNPEIQIVSNNDFSKVDFNKKVKRDEAFFEIKNKIAQLAKTRIEAAVALQENTSYIYEFFKSRIDWFEQMPDADNSYKERLLSYVRDHHAKTKGKYYIWGAIKLLCNGNSVGLVELVESVNPELEFAGWIDSFKTGYLAEKEIFSPKSFEMKEGDFVIVAAETAVDSALQCFAERGILSENYLILANTMVVQSDLDALLAEE